MDERPAQREAIERLQELGLKEYEARCFVALTRRPNGTAKEVSETSEVPRTRVYDAIDVLESRGLVETQHSSPKLFRAVPVDEAVETLRQEYETRVERLRESITDIEPVETDGREGAVHEVWALSGEASIESRVRGLIEDAETEVVLVVGTDAAVTDDLIDALRTAGERGVDVVAGTTDEEARDRLASALPTIQTYVSGLEWLSRSTPPDDDTEISRLLLIDRETILVSTVTKAPGNGRLRERAVFGRGFDNGIVAVARRLMATGFDGPD
jgi:sugar-specific transcriptional regulator TrmB